MNIRRQNVSQVRSGDPLPTLSFRRRAAGTVSSSTKHQVPSSKEAPGSKFQTGIGDSRSSDVLLKAGRPAAINHPGAWSLELVWDLELGTWSFSPHTSQPQRRRRCDGFTLIEILIAVAAFAIVLAAINTVFYSALRLRNSTTSAIEKALPVEHALGVIKRDLANLVLPGGTMSGTFTTSSTSNSVAGQSSPNFYTSSGVIDETSPFAEMQRVSYLLVASTNKAFGKDLVRSASRNLLPSLQDQPEQEWLMSGVEALTFLYLDGAQWRDSW